MAGPTRTRAHTLETANERSFLKAIPPEWTDSQPGADYGIDLRIEVFSEPDETGSCYPSGDEFGVQLKATDSEEATDLSIGIRWETYHYWRSLSYPVLVVRYQAAADRLFAMWAHDRGRPQDDSHLRRAWFRFDESHAMSEHFAAAARAEITAFKAAMTRNLRLPLRLHVPAELPTEWFVASNAALVSLLGEDQLLLIRGEGVPYLRFHDGRFEVGLGAGFGVVVHDDLRPVGVDPADIALLAGVCLGRVGAGDDAVKCIDAAQDSRLLTDPNNWSMATAALISSGKTREALELAQRHLRSHPASASWTLMIARSVGLDSDPEARDLACVMARELVEVAPTDVDRATALYNLATLHRSVNAHEQAVDALTECGALGTGYTERPYYWADLAGSLFMLNDYQGSADAYERARDLGDETRDLRQRRLDATLESGRYADVAQEVNGLEDPTSDEVLLATVADAIKRHFGIDQQARKPDQLRTLAKTDQNLTAADFAALDATDPGIWHLRLGELGPSASLAELAIIHVVAARLAPYELTAWAGAIVFSYGAALPRPIQTAVVDHALFRCGRTLATEVAEAIDAIGMRALDPDAVEQIFEDINAWQPDKNLGPALRDASTGRVLDQPDAGTRAESARSIDL